MISPSETYFSVLNHTPRYPIPLYTRTADVSDDSAGATEFFVMATVVYKTNKHAMLIFDKDAIRGKHSFSKRRLRSLSLLRCICARKHISWFQLQDVEWDAVAIAEKQCSIPEQIVQRPGRL